MRPNLQEETRYYSECMGDTTVPTYTINRRGSRLSQEITTSEGETRRRLMTPDELRTMPANEMLMIEAKSAPLILKTKLYFEERGLAERANLPYKQATPTHQQAPPAPAPSATARSSRTLPPAVPPSTGKTAAPPPIVVEADQEGDSDDSFFQQE